MKAPAQADLQRWSDEVARDPRSLAFLPLARAYRRQGLRNEAKQLCLRGLETYPTHVEAHGLLALLYLEAGDTTRAADEWSMVLRVDPDNFNALRGMGFCYLEQDQLSRARQMLERAALLRPADTAVQEALRVLGSRQDPAHHGTPRAAGAVTPDDPWVLPAAAGPAPDGATEPPAAPRAGASAGGQARSAATAPGVAAVTDDPTLLFDELLAAGPLLGALLIDSQGMVLGGRLTADVAGDAAVLGAVIGSAIGEAARTAMHLSLGEWRGILLEADHALLHIARAGDDAVVVLAARRNAPAGWMLRAAAQAADQAVGYLEAYA
ncbi:MAG: tetratricopeptide repeat protein [Gemmatimonadota bacterium]